MKVIIDRFEGDFAVVEIEAGKNALIAKSLVNGANEGDVIEITIDNAATRDRKEKIDSLMSELFD